MSLVHFFRILNKNLNFFLLSALVMATVVFMLTRNSPKIYESETEVYTGIASGMNLESVEGAALDFFATSNEYDNLINIVKSRQTLEEVGERLLVRHMMLEGPNPRYITEGNYNHFRFKIPKELQDSLLVRDSVELTLQNIREYKRKYYDTFKVKLTFEDGGSPYSYKAISRIEVYRVQNSDLVKIKYSWDDPGITQSTLEILNQVFKKKMAEIKESQSIDVINYFKGQVEAAEDRLEDVEVRLKDFRIKNRIINYEEQTKSIALLKEQMEDEYQREVSLMVSSKAAIANLEKQLASNDKLIEFRDKILAKRQELSEIKTQIAELEVYYNNDAMLSELRSKSDRLTRELNNDLKKQYELGKTTEGVLIRDLLTQWLAYSLAYDESQARLEVFESRKQYFASVYEKFAPLGSEIGKMTREIMVAEAGYLELLHSYNLALMKQKSETLASGGLVITVPPHYPLKARASKALLLVLVAGMVGFVVPFGMVVITEFLDNTIKFPQRIEFLTKLPLLGAFPNLAKSSEQRVDMEWLVLRSVGLISQNIRLESRALSKEDKKFPRRVVVFSTRSDEGKTLVTHLLANELIDLNYKVLVASFRESDDLEGKRYDSVTYDNREVLVKRDGVFDISKDFKETQYDFVFYIINGILTDQYPLDMVERSDMGLFVVASGRSWSKADNFALSAFLKTLSFEPKVVLNGVEPDNMDAVIGDIRKQRSYLRRLVKSILMMQFKGSRFKK